MPRVTNRTKDLDQAIGEMSEDQLHCRDYGHSWRAWTVSVLERGIGYEQMLRCQRCETLRRRVLDRSGDVISSGYVYAENYLVKGLGHLSGTDRGRLRIASVLATLEHGQAISA